MVAAPVGSRTSTFAWSSMDVYTSMNRPMHVYFPVIAGKYTVYV